MTKPYPKKNPLIGAVTDPQGNIRVARRLAAFAAQTRTHLRRVPEDVDQRTMNAMANVWAKDLVSGMGMRLNVEGQTHDGPALLVANHRSYTDIIALLAATPCCFLAKGDVANWPILGRAAVRAGTVFVDRHARDSRKAARDTMKRILGEGHQLVVFPEGTTFQGPGCQTFRPGAFETAIEAGVPVVPIAIEYPLPEDAWGDEGFVTHFTSRFRQHELNVHLHFGPALRGGEAGELMTESHEWIGTTLDVLWKRFREEQ